MQKSSEISEEIRASIADILEIDPAEIGPDTHFFEDLEMDSLSSLELVALLERNYQIQILEESLPSLVTLNGIVEVVSKQLVTQP